MLVCSIVFLIPFITIGGTRLAGNPLGTLGLFVMVILDHATKELASEHHEQDDEQRRSCSDTQVDLILVHIGHGNTLIICNTPR